MDDGVPQQPDVGPLRELLYRVLVRYLTVRPRGLELQPGDRLRPVVDARVLGHGGADLLPRSQTRVSIARRSASHHRRHRQGLRRPARAFFCYDAERRRRGVAIEDVVTKIGVVNRGSWGELRFTSRD